jgi:two pore calcium channel protein 3
LVCTFQVIINTLLHILPSLATYGSVLFVIYYSFAVAGMAAFAGKIQDGAAAGADCGAASLRGSEFAAEGYCPNNFNHLTASLTTLFELMVVNQWHVIAEGHALAAGTKWARLFFLAFHLTCVIVVLNIFTAFVLEAFILEYSASRRKVRSHLAERIYRMGLAHGQYNSFINNNVRLVHHLSNAVTKNFIL